MQIRMIRILILLISILMILIRILRILLRIMRIKGVEDTQIVLTNRRSDFGSPGSRPIKTCKNVKTY